MKNGETNKTAKNIVRSLSGTVDYIVLFILMAVLVISLYALWDAHQVYAAADSKRFEQYKPTEEDTLSFDELREMNPDVIAWLTVYDTKIDYPVLNSKVSNDEYLSRNPFGEIEAAGSLFIDRNNNKDFRDFNTIIFGHHMAERAMFGDIDLFLEKEFFDSHEYGNLFYGGRNHGIQFFAMVSIDAHDTEIYRVPASTEETKRSYLDAVLEKAKYRRDVEVSTTDHIVLLSTCSEDITNGRYLLVGKLLDHGVKNPFPEETTSVDRTGIDLFNVLDKVLVLPIWEWILILLLLIVAVYAAWRAEHHRYQKKLEKQEKS